MEVTLDKIELVRDRTGVSYKEAKDALEAADGSVVDAIIAIEESLDGGVTRSTAAKKEELVDKMKAVVAKGNVSRIKVSKDENTIINIPLSAGVLGAVIAPMGVIAGAIAAMGFKCKIEFVKEDGSIVDISEKAGDAYDKAKEKGSDVFFEIKEKAPGNLDELKTKAQDAFNDIREKAPDSFDELRAKGEEAFNKAKDAAGRLRKEAEEEFAEIKEDFEGLQEEGMSELEEMQREAAKGIQEFENEIKDEDIN